MARVILVRHCESESNRAGPEGAPLNSPLSALGRAQAEAVRAAFAAKGPRGALLLSSPLQRATDTAAAISAAIGGGVQLDDRLGAGEMVASRALDPGDPATLPIVGAEVLAALSERIEAGAQTLVVVSHRYPIWALLEHLYGARGTEIMDQLDNLANGDQLEITLADGRPVGEPTHRPLALAD
ncbi:MAG TPA: histidine phosphatase family protein [Caulobacteraceae bacterium]|nr:histidine phosphatase family protein [Caulobacteraceae bacterium]